MMEVFRENWKAFTLWRFERSIDIRLKPHDSLLLKHPLWHKSKRMFEFTRISSSWCCSSFLPMLAYPDVIISFTAALKSNLSKHWRGFFRWDFLLPLRQRFSSIYDQIQFVVYASSGCLTTWLMYVSPDLVVVNNFLSFLHCIRGRLCVS